MSSIDHTNTRDKDLESSIHHSELHGGLHGKTGFQTEKGDDLAAIAEEGHAAPFDEHGNSLTIVDKEAERRLRWKVSTAFSSDLEQC